MAAPEGIGEYGPFLGRNRVDLQSRTARVWINVDLPEEAFVHVAAHELGHILQTLRGFYKTSIRSELGPGTPEYRIQTSLSGATECVAIDQMIRPLGLDPSFSVNERYNFLYKGLRKVGRSHPNRGSFVFASSSLGYSRAGLEQPPGHWDTLRRGFVRKLPEVAEIAEGLLVIVLETGLATVEQRRDSMILLRNELGLKGKVNIEDPLTGVIL